MDESREIQKLHGLLQCTIYLMVLVEIMIFVYAKAPFLGLLSYVVDRVSFIPIYHKLSHSKFATLTLISIVSIGTLSKKKVDLNPKTHILCPLTIGFLLFLAVYGSITVLLPLPSLILPGTTWPTSFPPCLVH